MDKIFSPKLYEEGIIKPIWMRLIAGSHLDESVKRYIFLDADILVVQSFKELINFDMNGSGIAGVLDIGASEKRKAEHGLRSEDPYLNGGVMLVDLEYWRKNDTESKLIKMSETYPKKLRFAEQDLLNIAINPRAVLPPEYNIGKSVYDYKIKNLHFFYDDIVYGRKKYYSDSEIEYARKNPVIYHYGGYSPFSPAIKGNKTKIGPAWEKVRKTTPYADASLLEPTVSRIGRFIGRGKDFCFEHLPYFLAKLIYLIIHTPRAKNSKGVQ